MYFYLSLGCEKGDVPGGTAQVYEELLGRTFQIVHIDTRLL